MAERNIKVEYGSTKHTKHIDDNGSTKTSENNYRAGELVLPNRVRYEIKIRVHNDKEEVKAYNDFHLDKSNHPEWLDTGFFIDKKRAFIEKGYYYCVRSFTILEY